jgi:ribonuclease J
VRVRIHRGADEIGGNVVEVEHERDRIVLDLGLPLYSALGDHDPMPPINGLPDGASDLLGVILTHAHPDHYGLIPQVGDAVQIFCGDATARILSAAAFFTPAGMALTPADVLVDQRALHIGPFKVTPLLVDHSAYDALALLVEAGGRRLFYTGDIRGHGRKSRLFEALVAKPPPAIDVLLMEGTRIDERDARSRGLASEAAVEAEVLKTIGTAPGVVLALFSPQNIDRLVSIYRATRRSGRTLVLDLYGASVAAATGNSSIPQASWDGVRVYVPQAQRIRVKESGEFTRVQEIAASRIYGEELAANPERYVLLFRESMARELGRANCLDGAVAVWSMWVGYLSRPAGLRLREFLAARGVPLVIHHASGHATSADLLRLAAAVKARRVVPIHTPAPQGFLSLVENAEIRKDGEWWDV